MPAKSMCRADLEASRVACRSFLGWRRTRRSGKPPRQVFVVPLEEVETERKRRAQKFDGASSFWGRCMITCDLCGKAKDCLQKEIEGKEYDICSQCWSPLAQKLNGKGRVIRETVFLPPPRLVKEREDEDPKSLPGEPPKIWGAA